MDMRNSKNEIRRLCESGRFREALALCSTLCEKHAGDAELWFVTGAVHGALGQFAAAETCCRKALALAPNLPALHYNLGIALLKQCRAQEAEQSFRSALASQPANPEVLTGLGDSFLRQGKPADAIRYYRESLAIEPNQPLVLNNRALAFQQMGQFGEAEICYRQAAGLAPQMDTTYIEWSRMLLDRGELAQAVRVIEQGLAQLPAHANLRYQLGFAQYELGRREEALQSFDTCLASTPDHIEARFARAMIRRYIGRVTDAAADLQTLLDNDEKNARAHAGLAGLYKDEGRIEEMLIHDRRAVALNLSSAEYQSNLLMDLHYSEQILPSEIFDAHRAWGLTHGTVAEELTRHVNEPDPDRLLRIGYVSPDFKQHSVAHFIESVLGHHDRDRCLMFCYSNLRPEQHDSTTHRLRKASDLWRDIASLGDSDAATLIAADGIDILVDLSGHTAGNRLGVFARQPAPVQVSWIGYPDTTGLPAMDYRLTDKRADPEGHTDQYSTEKLLRITDGFLCYAPPDDAPDPGPLPCDRKGNITFGSLNNLAKVNDAVIAAWARILNAVPGSCLMLKGTALADKSACERILRRFANQGIEANRLALRHWTATTAKHLACYQDMDIALDTFPYNGTTTTCEALWMGVPVITLRGETHAGRVGLSLLNQMGLAEFAAVTADAYVELAVSLANDLPRLRTLRSTLRERMRGSSLTDGKGFCLRLENMFRVAWRRWCERRDGG
jgi:predicted O-linked N-acetylglucosamine transferase (SPINDLY family)